MLGTSLETYIGRIKFEKSIASYSRSDAAAMMLDLSCQRLKIQDAHRYYYLLNRSFFVNIVTNATLHLCKD